MSMKLNDKTLGQLASQANAVAVWRKRVAKNLSKPLAKLATMFTFKQNVLTPPVKGKGKTLVLVFNGDEGLTRAKVFGRINKVLELDLDPTLPLPSKIIVKFGRIVMRVKFENLPLIPVEVAEAA